MVQETVPAAKRRPYAHFRELRRARIFMRLREGWPYTEIAREEGLTDRRIRQIVSETLEKRMVDPPTDHAMLQRARLVPALRLAADAVISGDRKAIRYYLKLLDQLDRYQPAAARQAFDDEARGRLQAKMDRIAARSKPRTIEKRPESGTTH
jgi:Homeodomain-like domain